MRVCTPSNAVLSVMARAGTKLPHCAMSASVAVCRTKTRLSAHVRASHHQRARVFRTIRRRERVDGAAVAAVRHSHHTPAAASAFQGKTPEPDRELGTTRSPPAPLSRALRDARHTRSSSRARRATPAAFGLSWRLAYSAALGRMANGTIAPRALQRVAPPPRLPRAARRVRRPRRARRALARRAAARHAAGAAARALRRAAAPHRRPAAGCCSSRAADPARCARRSRPCCAPRRWATCASR